MSDLDKKQEGKALSVPGARVPASTPPRDPISKFRGRDGNGDGHDDDDARMGFLDHLMELRKRLWISIIAVFVCVVAAIVCYNPLYNFLVRPIRVVNEKYKEPFAQHEYHKNILDWENGIDKSLVDAKREDVKKEVDIARKNIESKDPILQDVDRVEANKRALQQLRDDLPKETDPARRKLHDFEIRKLEINEPKYIVKDVINLAATTPLGSMLTVIWAGIYGGLLLASPIFLYQLWAFVSPGLRKHEKRAIAPVFYAGVFFFVTGAAIAYYVLAAITFDFFAWLDQNLEIHIQWTAESCIEMLLTMMLISGLLCEIPLVVAGLARMDVIGPRSLTRHWRGCTFGSIALGAFVAPGNDVASLVAFSGLVLGIYLVSIVAALVFHHPTPTLEELDKQAIRRKSDDLSKGSK